MGELPIETYDTFDHELFPMTGSVPGVGEYPDLQAIEVRPSAWIQRDMDRGDVWLYSDACPDISRYMSEYGTFAVSTEALPGDVIAIVETVGVPVVLRPIDTEPGYFTFVSCAWLFSRREEPLNSRQQSLRPWRPVPWKTLSQELKGDWSPPHRGHQDPEVEVFNII